MVRDSGKHAGVMRDMVKHTKGVASTMLTLTRASRPFPHVGGVGKMFFRTAKNLHGIFGRVPTDASTKI